MPEPPRPVKWFVGLQIASALVGILLVPTVIPIGVGLSELAYYLGPILVLSFALQAFLIWKVWLGKNWARFTMLALFLWVNIDPWLLHNLPTFPVSFPHVGTVIAVSKAMAALQAVSFVTLFIRPTSEWFRAESPKPSLLFPNG